MQWAAPLHASAVPLRNTSVIPQLPEAGRPGEGGAPLNIHLAQVRQLGIKIPPCPHTLHLSSLHSSQNKARALDCFNFINNNKPSVAEHVPTFVFNHWLYFIVIFCDKIFPNTFQSISLLSKFPEPEALVCHKRSLSQTESDF